MYLVKNDLGNKIKSFTLDYLGGHPGIDAVLLNAKVALYENGLWISSGLSEDHIFVEWPQIGGIQISNGKHWRVSVAYPDGCIELQNSGAADRHQFLQVLRKICPEMVIAEVNLAQDKITDINVKRLEKRYQEQEQRVDAFIQSLGTEAEDQILSAWEEQLNAKLKFPFEAAFCNEAEPPQREELVEVVALDGFDEADGIVAVVKYGREKRRVPLSDLEPAAQDSANYQMLSDYHYWFISQ